MMDGFVELRIEQQRIVDGEIFPLCLQSADGTGGSRKLSTTHAIAAQRVTLDNLLRKHRGILFRNCGIDTVEDFHDLIVASDLEGMEYIGGAAVRTQLTSRVFTANESPSSEKIPFHHEMAQTPNPPTHLFFFCDIAPSSGGETPILVSSEICGLLTARHPQFMADIEQHGVKYIRYMPEYDDSTSAIGRGWRSTFQTDTPLGAESALATLGSTWEWQPNGDLKTVTAAIPAVRIDSGPQRQGKKSFFNSIVAAFTGWNDSRNKGETAVILADGKDTLLASDIIESCRVIMDEIAVNIPWQKGDIMLLDNRTVMHSRKPFEGPRRVLAGLVRDPLR